MSNHGEYEVICTKVDRLTEEIRALQQAVKHLKPPAEEESEEAWKNLIKLSEEISKEWQGSGAVEEIRGQRDKGLKE